MNKTIEANQKKLVEKLMPSIGETAWYGSFIVSFTFEEGTIGGINEQFERVSGYTKAELIGKNHRLLRGQIVKHPSITTRQGFYDMLSEVGYIKNLVVKNTRKDGGYYYVKGDFKKVVVEDVVYYISIRKDVTDEYTLIETTNTKEILATKRANEAEKRASTKLQGDFTIANAGMRIAFILVALYLISVNVLLFTGKPLDGLGGLENIVLVISTNLLQFAYHYLGASTYGKKDKPTAPV